MLRVRNRDLAEEFVQEAMLAAYRSRHQYAGNAAERTWVIQILRNKIADHYRRRQREVPATDVVSGEDPTDDLFNQKGHWGKKPGKWSIDPGAMLRQQDFLRVLTDCMEGIPERQKEVFHLKVMDEQATDDVCDILGVTRTNLGVLLHRARMKLRACLEINWFGSGSAGPSP
jgi:RNA polymerase sigma-70 factor (ECF subfamily)